MTGLRRGATVALLLALLLVSLAPAAALAAEPTFGQPSATAPLGDPLTITSTISGDDIAAVEALVRLAGKPTTVVLEAQPGDAPNSWSVSEQMDIATSALCACIASGESAPNTRFEYQFRVRAADGSVTVGPVGQGIVEDQRFEWRTLIDDQVRVHWYSGTDAFAQSAATVANEAIDRASELLGTSLAQPVDLFVYDTEEDLRSALSPNRENIAGQAHAAIQTMFVLIPGDESASDFAGTLVAHELTHLVFGAATDNPYSGVPRWMDEGVAVYLSEGYNSYWSSFVSQAVADRTLIPLDGLRGLFPSSRDEFFLAYAESVAAIDFFIRTYGEQKLWDLVRGYARGITDDDAFVDATGADLATFNTAWFASLGLDVPAPYGPQPGPPGNEPDDWNNGAPGTPAPSAAPGSSGAPGMTSPPATPGPGVPSTGDGALTRGLVVVGWLILVTVLVALLFIVFRQRARARRGRQG